MTIINPIKLFFRTSIAIFIIFIFTGCQTTKATLKFNEKKYKNLYIQTNAEKDANIPLTSQNRIKEWIKAQIISEYGSKKFENIISNNCIPQENDLVISISFSKYAELKSHIKPMLSGFNSRPFIGTGNAVEMEIRANIIIKESENILLNNKEFKESYYWNSSDNNDFLKNMEDIEKLFAAKIAKGLIAVLK